MVFLNENPDMMTMFIRRNWIRICHTCGEYVGNTALWIFHCLNSRRHIKIVSDKKKRYSSEDPQIEVDEDVMVPDWLFKCYEQSKWDLVD